MDSSYIVSARKYRPMSFDTVIGQHALTTTLKNAIASGRLAHAYLFCGPRGVGKTTCARIFAKTINCMSPLPSGEPCNECESCKAFNEQRSFNIHELDAASNNSVEDIRSLIEQVKIPPQVGKYKVFIIDEVHMLSQQAFNAFLKTLEEPPRHAIFILATTEKQKILPTILSRCQIYDFNRMDIADIVKHLKNIAEKEHIEVEDEALNIIAQKADGGMRDALSIFDQVSSFSNGHITYKKVIEDLNVLDYEYYFKLTDLFLAGDIPMSLLTFNEITEKGFDGQSFIGGLAEHFRNLLVSRDAVTLPLLEVADNIKQRYNEQAKRCNPKFLFKAIRLCNTCDLNYRNSRNRRLLVEITLIEVAQAVNEDDDSAGRSPKQLNPIFQPHNDQTQAPAAATTKAPTAATTATAPRQTTPSTSTPAKGNTPASGGGFNFTAQNSSPRPLGRLHTISIRGTQPQSPAKTQEQQLPKVQEEQIEERRPVESKNLTLPWLQYANRLPQEQTAMAARMKNMNPFLAGPELIRVEVENQQVKQDLQEISNDLIRFMRKTLHNSHLQLEIGLMDLKKTQRAYTKREQLEAIIKKYPDVEQLRKELKLEFT